MCCSSEENEGNYQWGQQSRDIHLLVAFAVVAPMLVPPLLSGRDRSSADADAVKPSFVCQTIIGYRNRKTSSIDGG